jgi:hypothetical protein
MNTPKAVKDLAIIRHELANNSVELVLNDAVKDFMELKSSIEGELKATWNALQDYMLDNDIKTIENLTIAEKKTWKAERQLPPRFYKQTLDTSRLTFMLEHGDALPKGVAFKTSKYLTKTNRKVTA